MAWIRWILLAAVLAALTALFALPESAAAVVYCVPDNSVDPACQTAEATIQDGIDAAEASAGPDTVKIGSGTYPTTDPNGFYYNTGNGPVTIDGAGQGQTVITVTAPVSDPGFFTQYEGIQIDSSGDGSAVSDLTVTLPTPTPPNAHQQYLGIDGGTLDIARVTVSSPPAAPINGFGILIHYGGVTDATVDLSQLGTPGDNGLQAAFNTPSNLSIDRSTIKADEPVTYTNTGTGTLTIDHTTLLGRTLGVNDQIGTVRVRNTLIDLGAFSGRAVWAGYSNSLTSSTDNVDLDGVTITGHGGGTGVFSFATDANSSGPPDASTVTVRDSILDTTGLDQAIDRESNHGGSANVTVDYSDHDPSTDFSSNLGAGSGSISSGGHDVNVFPAGFVDPALGNFHLLPGSALVDIGDPAAPSPGATDLDGDPRAVMAIASCTPRRDIGADEFVPSTAITPLDCTPPDTSVNGKPKVKTRKKRARVTFTFSATEPSSSFACSLDGGPFTPCSSPFSAKLRRGAHTLSVRSTDASGNADPTPAGFTTKVKRKR
jgi:hypothetical protein